MIVACLFRKHLWLWWNKSTNKSIQFLYSLHHCRYLYGLGIRYFHLIHVSGPLRSVGIKATKLKNQFHGEEWWSMTPGVEFVIPSIHKSANFTPFHTIFQSLFVCCLKAQVYTVSSFFRRYPRWFMLVEDSILNPSADMIIHFILRILRIVNHPTCTIK